MKQNNSCGVDAVRCRLALALLSWTAAAQGLAVYSELTRVDPFGQPVAVDRGARPPREILSPAIPRNAVSSFQVVVDGRPGQPYTVQVAQNPEDAVRVVAYRERYTRIGDQWIPDALELVKLPVAGRLETAGISGQTAQAFWMDLLVDRSAPVRRIKVEPQAYMDDRWVRYPMEVRILRTALGTSAPRGASGVEDAGLVSSASAIAAWMQLLCHAAGENSPTLSPSIRDFIARNAAQDVAFAAALVPPVFLRIAAVPNRAALCRLGKAARSDAEDYLYVRDAVIGARE